MSLLRERQETWIADYTLLGNPLDRLAAIVDRAARSRDLAPEDHADEHLVPGCTSRVWVTGTCPDGRCRFRGDAESPVLKGLVLLLTEFYSGASPEEVIAVEPDFLDRLHLTDRLTPTRRHGLAKVRERLVHLARSFLPPSPPQT
jgi:cysteine desulfuration protein SufE